MGVAISKAKKVQGVQVQGVITKNHKDGSSEEKKIPIKTVMADEQMANVGVSVSITKNLGNYESLKMTVSLYMPCIAQPEEIEATYAETKNWVDTKINEINEEVEATLNS